MTPIFHISLSVSDLAKARAFYEGVLSARSGRATETWIDVWLFGAQLTLYHRPAAVLPSPFKEAQHFGATVDWSSWCELHDDLKAREGVFAVPPTLDREKGVAKLVLRDPDGYLIEIKAYRDPVKALGLGGAKDS